MPDATIRAGAGGHGAKIQPLLHEETTMTDRVAQIAEKSQQNAEDSQSSVKSETVLRERRDDEPPNPKKRMWEEPVNEGAQDSPARDEL